jgi:hypothetical protein
MKWKTFKIKEGEKRVKTRFAFFPKILTDGYTVWLESYRSQQIYTKFVDPINCYYFQWNEVESTHIWKKHESVEL